MTVLEDWRDYKATRLLIRTEKQLSPCNGMGGCILDLLCSVRSFLLPGDVSPKKSWGVAGLESLTPNAADIATAFGARCVLSLPVHSEHSNRTRQLTPARAATNQG